MISIIVPVFNAEKFLDRCVQSILEQTYEKFELILVDDGSTDSSRMLCDKYAVNDKRVRSFHKLNGGANSARIMGLEYAYGEFVVFVDSDDFIHSDALEILINNMNEGIDAVIANTDENIIESGIDWAKKLLERKVRSEIWGGVYKCKSLKEAFRFIPHQIVIGEDLLTNICYAIKAEKVKFIDKKLYSYNQSNVESLVHSYKLSLLHEKLFVESVDSIVGSVVTSDRLSFSLFMNRYLTLERLIYLGENPYHEEWVKFTMQEKVRYKNIIGFKEKFLLSIPYAWLCRHVLKISIGIKKIIRNNFL